jgi:hypothetical protein
VPAPKITLWLDAHAFAQGNLACALVRLPINDYQAIRAAAGQAIAPPHIAGNCRPRESADASDQERDSDRFTIVAREAMASGGERNNATSQLRCRAGLLAGPNVYAPSFPHQCHRSQRVIPHTPA